MFQNYFNFKKILKTLIITLWVLIGFYSAQIILAILFSVIHLLKIDLSSISDITINFVAASMMYVIILAIVVGVPWYVKKHRTSLSVLGLKRLPTWTDILLTPAAMIIYLLVSSVLIVTASNIMPWIDINQSQDTGFNGISFGVEYILAFIALVIIAPVAEEVIFRGYLYGNLRKNISVWWAIIITSVLFGFVHGAWNLAIDTFALSVVLCLLREKTGSLWSPILLHMAKNGLAFYILFINPSLLAILI